MMRSSELLELDAAVESQRRALQEIKDKGLALDDDRSIKRNYTMILASQVKHTWASTGITIPDGCAPKYRSRKVEPFQMGKIIEECTHC